MSALKVVAIVSAFNEADIIESTTSDLIAQGVQVYLLDHDSTDGTADRIRHLLGRGVIGIERRNRRQGEAETFRLSEILKRKEELAATLDADWLINHDSDELREAPWRACTLAEGIGLVDRLGWNAIDFAVLNFAPTSDGYREGDDLRAAFRFFSLGETWDRLQIRCWKKQPAVDLISSAGHEASFPGRRVCPIRFLLRHYPVRTQLHGERKIFTERRPLFDPEERARGWHVQYDQTLPGHNFVQSPERLTEFDPDRVRVQLQVEHRGMEELRTSVGRLEKQLSDLQVERDGLANRTREIERLLESSEQARAALDQLVATETCRRQEIEQDLQAVKSILDETRGAFEADRRAQAIRAQEARGHIESMEREIGIVSARLRGILDSRSWRWTAPVRSALRRFYLL